MHFLITGERGIGKSSLFMFLKHISTGGVEGAKYGSFNFVTLNFVLSDRMTLETLVRLIERQLSRELSKIESVKSFFKDAWAFVQRIKVMDSGIDRVETNDTEDMLIDELAYSPAETCNRLLEKGTDKDGILFLIDEADNAHQDLRIGYLLKTLTELIQQNGCHRIMFAVAGLPDVVTKLKDSHESSIRIFQPMKIKELHVEDREWVVKRGIEEGNKINKEEISISDEALNTISVLSEGYPHFIQQFAFSAYETNEDLEINREDVLEGAFQKGGAIDSIGTKYYENNYFDKIKSDEYRLVLSIMAENLNEWVKKSEIRDKFPGDENTLNNALSALVTRKIILRNSSRRGEYRLQQRGFALWIKMFGERKKNR